MKTLNTTYDEDYYSGHAAGSKQSAQVVLPIIFDLLGVPGTLVDVGCGVGTWLAAAHELVPELDLLGVDYPRPADNPPSLIAPERFVGVDFSRPFALARHFDLILCLEVAEHLDPRHADSFLDSLTSLGDTVVFSAAIPGQGGVHHVNERFPHYWIGQFARRGFTCYDVLRPRLWLNEEVEFWYQQNLLIFSRHALPPLAALPSFRGEPLVHPHLIRQRVEGGLLRASRPLRRLLLKKLRVPPYRHMHIEPW